MFQTAPEMGAVFFNFDIDFWTPTSIVGSMEETLFETVDKELKRLNGQYITGPTGIGSGVSEFKSVYSREADLEVVNVDRQENLSIITTEGLFQFKVF